MGTYPIFESDFDCLTEEICSPVSLPVKHSVNQFARSLQQLFNQPRRLVCFTRPSTFASWATFSATSRTCGSMPSTPRSTVATKRSSHIYYDQLLWSLISLPLSHIYFESITFSNFS